MTPRREGLSEVRCPVAKCLGKVELLKKGSSLRWGKCPKCKHTIATLKHPPKSY
jgi:hypothetical protein